MVAELPTAIHGGAFSGSRSVASVEIFDPGATGRLSVANLSVTPARVSGQAAVSLTYSSPNAATGARRSVSEVRLDDGPRPAKADARSISFARTAVRTTQGESNEDD